MRHIARLVGQSQNLELRKKVGKLSLPYYDALGKIITQAWVQKVDTYLQLNPMPKEEAIEYAAIHLDGLAHEWWQHGMVTLGHNQITSYEFSERLIERFDTKILSYSLKSWHSSRSGHQLRHISVTFRG